MPTITTTDIEQQNLQRQRCMVACVGYRLKCLRLKKRLSVNQVSTTTGLHKKVIERIEAGGHFFGIRTIETLAHNYQTTIPELFTHTHTPPTRQQWQQVKKWQKQLNRSFKSKDRKPPQVGMQLKLEM